MASHLKILERHGTTRQLYEHSLENAKHLASGHLPLVVVMQEPCDLADTVPYDNMVYGDDSADMWTIERVGCPALQEVERLAEDASDRRYCLEDFSLFDINTLLSPNMQDDSEDLAAELLAAHQTFWNMIKAKAPKVILVLTCIAGRSQHKPVTLLSSSLKSAGSIRRISLWSNSIPNSAVVIQGFHPSVYLRDDYSTDQGWSHEEVFLANRVLRYCFQKAFDGLSDEASFDFEDGEVLQAWRAQCRTREELRSLEESLRRRLALS